MNDELINVNEFLELIREQLQVAQAHLEVIFQELTRLKRAGMYPSIPHEQWQTRNGGETKYLYMLFRQGRDGRFEGPDGKRKLYIGCDTEKISEARRLVKNSRRYFHLEKLSRNLHGWITQKVYDVRYLADSSKHWQRDESLLGPPGPGQEEPGCPKEDMVNSGHF